MSSTILTAPPRTKISVALEAHRLPVEGKSHLDFLDGIRGWAAFYVVFHHISQIYLDESAKPEAGYYWFSPLMQLGHFAVAIFILLSGFCLMLPVARSNDGRLRGGFAGYFWRRVRRIVPAYYAAIALCFLLVAFVPAMRRHDVEFWNYAFAGDDWRSFFDWKVLTSHLLILHALNPNWINRIDPPMWSVGVEWLNYFLMPLLLIPIWKRAGNVALVVFATALSFLPYVTQPIFHHKHYTMYWAHPWYLALFAIGMAGAGLLYAKPTGLRKIDGFILKCALHPGIVLLLAGAIYLSRHQRVPMDFLIGAATLSVILHCAAGTTLGRYFRKPLESKFAIWLGAISYSLYLFHGPLLMLLHRLIEPQHLTAGVRLAAMMGAGVPLTLLAGWIGYRVFERPFMGQAKRVSAEKTAQPDVATATASS